MDSSSEKYTVDGLLLYIKNLESRISRLETKIGIENQQEDVPSLTISNKEYLQRQTDSLEDQIGQFWFAKVGIIILVIGIIYLLTFPYKQVSSIIPGIAGYGLVMGMFFFSKYLKESFELLSKYIFGSTLLLAFFSTMRLHFFSETPVVDNLIISSLLLLSVSLIHILIAYKRESTYLLSIGVLLFSCSSLVSDNIYLIGIVLSLTAIMSVIIKEKLGSTNFVIISILAVYIVHSWWLIGNPFLSEANSIHSVNYLNQLFILFYFFIFSLVNILRKEEGEETSKEISVGVLNTILPFFILLFSGLSNYREMLPFTFLFASLIFVGISMALWIRQQSKYLTFLYAITGYLSMSVSIIGFFPKPDFFVWLCWESLIVVSTAVWYKSKIIVVANFIIYVLIYFSYLILAGSFGVISLTFGFVALLSARILNWQKHRLELRTEMMRNAYLASALFIFPYALYHIVPKDYVGLSWMIVALLYYLLSRVIKNKKYRWMSILTLLLTVIYIVVFGTSNLNPTYRILSFLFLGTALIIVSIFYARRKKINRSETDSD